MASKKGQGSTQNGRDSAGQSLGIKAFGGELVTAGSIIAKQRGTKWHPGLNVRMAKDDSIFALVDGAVKFGRSRGRVTISVIPKT